MFAGLAVQCAIFRHFVRASTKPARRLMPQMQSALDHGMFHLEKMLRRGH
jgi:hypothetical protein